MWSALLSRQNCLVCKMAARAMTFRLAIGQVYTAWGIAEYWTPPWDLGLLRSILKFPTPSTLGNAYSFSNGLHKSILSCFVHTRFLPLLAGVFSVADPRSSPVQRPSLPRRLYPGRPVLSAPYPSSLYPPLRHNFFTCNYIPSSEIFLWNNQYIQL